MSLLKRNNDTKKEIEELEKEENLETEPSDEISF